MRLTWVQPEDLLTHEFIQSQDEGRDVAAIRQRWIDAGGDPVAAVSGAGPNPASPELRELARGLLVELATLPTPSEADEPDGWDEIQALTPLSGPAADISHHGDDLADRLMGAWTGRAAGCLLGKPVEKIPREGIEAIARSTGNWPIRGWFTGVGLDPQVAQRWPWNRRSAPTSLAENIDGTPEDDDLNFPLLALHLVESHGRSFTTDDVIQAWLDHLPAGRVFTAERVAYRNILDARPVPETATHMNPFREWIGALIRTDVFGWINPGDHWAAAELAHRDARLSHTRNGIYGAMWAAALASHAVVQSSVEDVLDQAQAVVPPQSRLARAVSFGRRVAHDHDLTEGGIAAAMDRIHAEFGSMHWVHTLNNAAVIAYALQAGGGDFGQSVSLAVTAGWDTDSAGATVGGVVGAVGGVEAMGREWSEPLRNVIRTSLPGGDQAIDTLAARTFALIEPKGGDR